MVPSILPNKYLLNESISKTSRITGFDYENDDHSS